MEISITNFSFSPDTITIPVGTKVTWTNKDSVGHTVTSDDTGGVLKSPLIEQNKTFEYTFDKAGTYAYHCTPHPFMKAKIIVTP
jgi:amicyanin